MDEFTPYVPQYRPFLIALQHHAEGLTFEQIGALHKISGGRAYQLYRAALDRLQITKLPKNVTAADVGCAIQRQAEYRSAERGWGSDSYVGSPLWMQNELRAERQRDFDAYVYKDL